MVKLVFDPIFAGHHPEYLHHIYQAASADIDNMYVFAIPNGSFDNLKRLFNCQLYDNIYFRFLSDYEIQLLNGSLFTKCLKESIIIRKLEEEFQPDEILLIDLAPTIPILPFIIRRAKISGIIYQIYLWNPKKGIRGIIDKIRYRVIAKHGSIKSVFILNDMTSTKILNKLYNSIKFKYLPDPVVSNKKFNYINIRNAYGINKSEKIYIHFGAMSRRKGTLIALESLLLMKKSMNKVFIFAGKISDEIKQEFLLLKSKIINRGIKLIVKDDFLSYDEIHSLCASADCILIPYTAVSLSSGVLGYASLYNTPVIGPAQGLIGELIKNYDLGKAIGDLSPETLAKEIDNFKAKDISRQYADERTILSFTNILLG